MLSAPLNLRRNRLALLACLALSSCEPNAEKTQLALQPHVREPVAVVAAKDGRTLYVANRRAGSVSILDVDHGRTIREVVVGTSLAYVVEGNENRLLAVDEKAGELITLERKDSDVAVLSRVPVCESPVRICRLPTDRAAIASTWARELVVVDLKKPRDPRVVKKLALPFAPRELLPLPGEAVLVADAFGGRLAVVDARRGEIRSVRSIPGHNVRGLALHADGKEILLTHQLLTEETPTHADEVRWGNVISNVVRVLPTEDVLNPQADLLRRSQTLVLGGFGRGAADPATLATLKDEMIVTLAGTGEVALGSRTNGDWLRLAVGKRPLALAVSGKRCFVADAFGDEITVIDLEKKQQTAAISLGPMSELSAAQRGERLFFDGHLSKEGWMSCHSCHSDGHTNGMRSDTLGDGSYGAAKRIPTLLGVGDTEPWAWNGSMERLEKQVRSSIESTMRGNRPSEERVADLTAYLRTLPPPPLSRGEPSASAQRGATVFRERGCIRCHAPPTYTTPRTYEVGLRDELDKIAFNPPSLRGVRHGVAFFHDGRATTLEEVFTRHHHQLPADVPHKELDELIAFLKTL